MFQVPENAKKVNGREGLLGWMDTRSHLANDNEVVIQTINGNRLIVPRDLLREQGDGSFFLPLTADQLQKIDAKGAQKEALKGDLKARAAQKLADQQKAAETAPAPGDIDQEELLVIPVVVEKLDVNKDLVTTGRIRVTKTVQEHEETIDQPAYRETVDVKRVPVDQFVTEAPDVRQEGDTLIIPVLEEVLVVEKRLRVKEEIRVTRQREQIQNPQKVTLRSEEVKVDRIKADHEHDNS